MTTTPRRLAIIVPTFNRRDVTVRYLDAVLADPYEPKAIIVCDSSSTDGTREAVAQRPGITVHQLGSDQWWSAAVNTGIRDALQRGFDYLLLANDDVTVPSDHIQRLMATAATRPDAILTPVQRSGGRMFYGEHLLGRERRRSPATAEGPPLKSIDYHNGLCLLVPRHVFERVGLINERACPSWNGDVEFLLRARNAGIEILVVRDIVIEHVSETNVKSRLTVRNVLRAPFSGSRVEMRIAMARQLYGSLPRSLMYGLSYYRSFVTEMLSDFWIAIVRNRAW